MDAALLTALRQEIIESQKSQAELLKWKLIATAAVAGAGLGIQVPALKSDARLLVCLIPLICAYVDLLSLHIVVRIIVIARFLRLQGDPYETFLHEYRNRREKPFSFELMALHGSSRAISGIVFAFGVWGYLAQWQPLVWGAYLSCGLIGFVLAMVLSDRFSRHLSEISELNLPPPGPAAPAPPSPPRP